MHRHHYDIKASPLNPQLLWSFSLINKEIQIDRWRRQFKTIGWLTALQMCVWGVGWRSLWCHEGDITAGSFWPPPPSKAIRLLYIHTQYHVQIPYGLTP
jgi:hypothetical protein